MALSQNPQDDPAGTKYSAPIPLDAPPAPVTPATAPPAAASAPPSATAPPQASPAPANAPSPSADPLAGVMARIAQPESGGRNVLYGGAPVPPGNVIPGAVGPTGQQTHAFSKYQFEPATWNDLNKAASAWGRTPLNKDNPQDVEWAGRYLARKTYGKDANGRTLDEAAAAGDVDYSRLAHVWPSLAKGAPGFPDSTQANKIRQDKYAEAADLDKSFQTALKQINASADDLPKQMERIRAAQEKADKAQDASLAAITKSPKQPELDAVQHLGSLATVVGILGGLLTRAPMRASINGMASALEAYNSGDQLAYQQAYKNWQSQTDMLFKVANMQSERVRQIMYEEDMGNNERNALMDTTLRAYGLHDLANRRRTEGDESVLDWQEKMAAAQESHVKWRATLDNTEAYRQNTIELQRGRLALEQQKDQPLPPFEAPPEWQGMPGQPPPGMDPTSWSYALNYVKTKTPPPLGWGNNLQRQQFGQAIPVAQKALGIDPADQDQQWIKFAGDQRRATAIESAFGSGIMGRNMVSLNTVADHMSLLRDYATALNNKDLQRANQFLNRWKTETGHPEVNDFKLAATITGDEIVRLLTTTGGTEADRQDVQARFAAINSPDQLQSVIDTASNYVRGRYEPLRQQYARGDPTREAYFNDKMVTPEARELFEGARKPVAGASQQGWPVPKEHEGDPEGQTYNNGHLVKRGDRIVPNAGSAPASP